MRRIKADNTSSKLTWDVTQNSPNENFPALLFLFNSLFKTWRKSNRNCKMRVPSNWRLTWHRLHWAIQQYAFSHRTHGIKFHNNNECRISYQFHSEEHINIFIYISSWLQSMKTLQSFVHPCTQNYPTRQLATQSPSSFLCLLCISTQQCNNQIGYSSHSIW